MQDYGPTSVIDPCGEIVEVENANLERGMIACFNVEGSSPSFAVIRRATPGEAPLYSTQTGSLQHAVRMSALLSPRGAIEQDVRDFMLPTEQRVVPSAGWPEAETVALRRRLIEEECGELLQALDERDLVGVIDGCIDLVYVVVGTMLSFGVPFAPFWDEVQRSNLSKLIQKPDGSLGCVKDEGGKVCKPVGYSPPRIREILERLLPRSAAPE